MKDKINLILSQVGPSPQIYSHRDKTIAALEAVVHATQSRVPETSTTVYDPGDHEVTNEQVILLRTLYAAQSAELQATFPAVVFGEMTEGNAAVVIAALLGIGYVAGLINTLAGQDPVGKMHLRLNLWKALREALSKQSQRFTDQDLTELEKVRARDMTWSRVTQKRGMISGPTAPATVLLPPLPHLRPLIEELERANDTIKRVQYLRLKKELLEGANPEINTDKQLLVSRMGQLGFRREIVSALQELDRKVYGAGTPLDFKGCMDLARTIFEEIIEDAGRKAAAIKQHPLPPTGVKGNFTPWRKVLVATGALSGSEGVISQEIYNYLSTTGAHGLGSAPEQVKVAKNMVIECGLLVVGRVQAMK